MLLDRKRKNKARSRGKSQKHRGRIRNEVEPSGLSFCPEGSTHGLSTQDFRSILQGIYHIYLRLFRAFGEKSPSTEAWRTLIPFSSDFCYAITDLQDQKESPLHPIEPCWRSAWPKKSQRDRLRRVPLGKRSLFGLPCC